MIRQTEAAECGLACLAMVARSHGQDSDLASLRRRFPISLKGASLKSLIEIASSIGLGEGIGTLWNLPNTAIGLVLGGAGYPFDNVFGDGSAQVSLGSDGVVRHLVGSRKCIRDRAEAKGQSSRCRMKNISIVRAIWLWVRALRALSGMIVAFVFAIASAAGAHAAPPIPPILAANIAENHFDPGDYAWARGAFAGATRAQVSDWKAIESYARECRGMVPEDVRQELTERGFAPPKAFWQDFADDLCAEVSIARNTTHGVSSWESYQAALREALPVYDALVVAADQARAAAPLDAGAQDTNTVRDQLAAATVPDQILRMAWIWLSNDSAAKPRISPAARGIVASLLARPVRAYDRANSLWLKGAIRAGGWPKISAVGEVAASHAWLIAQHSDHDPAFQIDVLKLIEPLLERGEVSGEDFAALHDRVMVALIGRQTYGSQFTCERGEWMPEPLDEPSRVDERRAAIGLSPLRKYKEQLVALYGARCSS